MSRLFCTVPDYPQSAALAYKTLVNIIIEGILKHITHRDRNITIIDDDQHPLIALTETIKTANQKKQLEKTIGKK